MDSSIILLVLIVVAVIVIANRSRSLKHKNTGAPPPDLWRNYRSALDGMSKPCEDFRIKTLLPLWRVKAVQLRGGFAPLACQHNLCQSIKLKRCCISTISRTDIN